MQTLYQNNRIRIRPYEEDDLEGLYSCVSSSKEQMSPYLPWVHAEYSRQDSQSWIAMTQSNWQHGGQFDFVIEDLADDTFLGGVGLLHINEQAKAATLGYWLRTDQTGKGIATDAAKLALLFAKEQLKLEKIIIYTSTENAPSITVAKKLGATYIDTKENFECHQGKWIDCCFYEIKL